MEVYTYCAYEGTRKVFGLPCCIFFISILSPEVYLVSSRGGGTYTKLQERFEKTSWLEFFSVLQKRHPTGLFFIRTYLRVSVVSPSVSTVRPREENRTHKKSTRYIICRRIRHTKYGVCYGWHQIQTLPIYNTNWDVPGTFCLCRVRSHNFQVVVLR